MNCSLLYFITKLKSPSFLGLLFLSLIVTLNPVRAIAQVITNITLDPYNNSGYEAIPIDNNSTQIRGNLPRGNNNTAGVISIKGNPTPPRLQFIDGNLATSDQSLPSVPPIGQPFSSPSQMANQSNSQSGDLSASPSGVDYQEETVTISNTSQNPSDKIPSQNNRNIPELSNETGGRRNLRDILVFSETTPPISPVRENSTGAHRAFGIVPKTTTSNNNSVFKVLVRVNSSSQESEIRQLYPDAFRTNHQGVSFLQVGVFSNQATAQQLSQSLKNSGFNPLVVQ